MGRIQDRNIEELEGEIELQQRELGEKGRTMGESRELRENRISIHSSTST